MRALVLLGDYGSGKTVVIQSVAEKLRNSDRDIVYINALDTTDDDEYHKTWEDVLNVIVKLRFGSGVTVLDIGTLRRQYCERDRNRNSKNAKVSFLKLLNDYISNLTNAKNTVVGLIENILEILIS